MPLIFEPLYVELHGFFVPEFDMKHEVLSASLPEYYNYLVCYGLLFCSSECGAMYLGWCLQKRVRSGTLYIAPDRKEQKRGAGSKATDAVKVNVLRFTAHGPHPAFFVDSPLVHPNPLNAECLTAGEAQEAVLNTRVQTVCAWPSALVGS